MTVCFVVVVVEKEVAVAKETLLVGIVAVVPMFFVVLVEDVIYFAPLLIVLVVAHALVVDALAFCGTLLLLIAVCLRLCDEELLGAFVVAIAVLYVSVFVVVPISFALVGEFVVEEGTLVPVCLFVAFLSLVLVIVVGIAVDFVNVL